MKIKGFTATTAIIIAVGILCVAVCAGQTAYLVSFQNLFAAEHPTYVPHSWIMLTFLLVPTVLACGQVVVSRKRELTPKRLVLCCIMSVVMVVLEVLALRAAADQHYHMGMLESDYGIQVPFESGWLLLFLVMALIAVTVTQLLITLFAALSKHSGM